jgi:cytochrome c553
MPAPARPWRERAFRRAIVFSAAALLALPVAAQKAVDPTRGAAKAEPCTACHGSGERPPQAGVPFLAGQQREFLVLQMFYLREGLRDVPEMVGMFKGYVDRDLEDVAAYYNSQPLPRIESTSNPVLLRKGADLSRAMGCGSCHLADYRGQKHVPRIAGQREDYLVIAMKAYRDNKRTGTDTSMNAAMYRVTDAEVEALAHYLAQQ